MSNSLIFCIRYFVVLFILSADTRADDLPQNTPNLVLINGRRLQGMIFTTKAYHDEALRQVLEEANQIAIRLKLPESFPISKPNITKTFISPYGYARLANAIGNIATTNYCYYISLGNKFSYIESPHQDELGRKFQASHTLPISEINTNEALALAIYWLAAIPADMAALQSNCTVTVELDKAYVHPRAGKFVPVYYVSWSEKDGQNNGVASVRLFTPTKTLMQLRVEDPKYILRPAIVFTNLAELLATNTATGTNAPGSP
jgi:hypothetical protein